MFRQTARFLITTILRWEARLVLKKYQPKIIAITGSVGKTGTKDAIATVLSGKFRLRASQKSFNHEIGLPLTILNCDNAWWNLVLWLKNIIEGLGLILFRTNYPELLVLEVGIQHPGDVARLVSWLKLDVAVITRLPEVPVHVEFFKSAEEVTREKWLLAQAVSESGLVIYNHDDEKIRDLADGLKARKLSYGFQTGSDLLASDVQIIYENQPVGLSVQITYAGESVKFELHGVLGEHQLYALLAAAAAAVAQGMSLASASEALKTLTTPPGRMRLLAGIKETLIIDDTYNASPAAIEAALQTLNSLQITGRKIAVLGDMLELGKYTIDEHRKVGILASRVSDVLVTVGLRMKFAVEEAMKKKMGKKNVYHFDDSRQAGEFLQNFIAPADVILVKGSQSLRMERVVEEIMAQPEEKSKLLVRQDENWSRR
ncbi:MAG: UDP-N-acetylmuramoyl-tripeptide--D-alanyl-D-alanine ligase [Patescibacteria group bacterium]